MNIVAIGNTTDTSRQASHYTTRTYDRYLVGMNTWTIGVENIAAQFGDLANLAAHGLDMRGYSAYLKNVYLQGYISDVLGDNWFDSRTGDVQLYNRTSGCGISFKGEYYVSDALIPCARRRVQTLMRFRQNSILLVIRWQR